MYTDDEILLAACLLDESLEEALQALSESLATQLPEDDERGSDACLC